MSKMMKNILKKLVRDEEGQAFILVLIFLLVGGLIIAPLLGFMSTGLLAGQMHEEKMDELYAADAGIEDALYKIKSDDALLQGLGVNDSYTYTLTSSVNGISPISITVTKLSLIEGIIDESEYNPNQPHEDWMGFDTPAAGRTYGTDGDGDYVEYLCNITFDYAGGAGNRRVQGVGAFFYPFSGSVDLISPPVYGSALDIEYVPVMTRDYLVGDEPELYMTLSGFAFIWRWQETPDRGPLFWSDDTGALTFSFRVYNDPVWLDPAFEAKSFGWATVKEQDISYITNAPDSYNWLIEATAEDTEVRSAVLDDAGLLNIRAWEINPQ